MKPFASMAERSSFDNQHSTRVHFDVNTPEIRNNSVRHSLCSVTPREARGKVEGQCPGASQPLVCELASRSRVLRQQFLNLPRSDDSNVCVDESSARLLEPQLEGEYEAVHTQFFIFLVCMRLYLSDLTFTFRCPTAVDLSETLVDILAQAKPS